MVVSSLELSRFLALMETTNGSDFGEYPPQSLVLYVNPRRIGDVQWDVAFRAVPLETADRLTGVWHALGIDKFPPADWSEIKPKDVQVVARPTPHGGQANARSNSS